MTEVNYYEQTPMYTRIKLDEFEKFTVEFCSEYAFKRNCVGEEATAENQQTMSTLLPFVCPELKTKFE